MIYTSYFANWRNFPRDSLIIGVTRFPPSNIEFNIDKLAPSANLLRRYQNKEIDEYVFEVEYKRELRESGLTPDKVKEMLNKISYNKDIILCCYEKTGEFCHRHILAKWLGDNINEYEK